LSNPISNYWAIVPAAGIGSRMSNSCPKQYLHLHGKAILQHTLERLSLPNISGIIVPVAKDDSYWKTLTLPQLVTRVNGGTERCYSVLNALQTLHQYANPHDWVLIHDAARPCVRQSDIKKLMTTLENHSVGGLLAVPVRDTMKRTQGGQEVIETVNRQGLWHALTPQMFRLETLYQALTNILNQGELVTDDAQAMEKMGYHPVLVEGHADNIKITHPQDLNLAELYLQCNEG
jgi:2-C-methyl-D-erythritol 4-phosphate cytidylyltransferase